MFDFLRSRRQQPVLPEGTQRRHYRFYGRVQGVGFRYRAKYAAQSLELTGWVRNDDDGTVEMEVQGQPENIDRLLPMIQQNDFIHITELRVRPAELNPWETKFYVRG